MTIIDNTNDNHIILNKESLIIEAFKDLIKEGKITKEEILSKINK